MGERALFFNGIEVETGEYRRAPMGLAEFQARIAPGGVRPDPAQPKDLAAWADPNKLAEAGWGVLVHGEEPPETLAALAPLLARRSEMVGRPAPPIVVTAEDLAEPAADAGIADRFLARHGVAFGDVDPAKLPYYLLILGSPDRIPFAFQYELDVSHAVGRLDLDSPDQYAAYAENVVAVETGKPLRPARAALFGPEHDPLTKLSAAHLLQPLAARLPGLAPGWDVQADIGAAAVKQRLEDRIGGDAPALLLTASHAVYSTKNRDRRLREQGGLLCADWAGPGVKPQRGDYYSALDAPAEPDCRGMICFLFACFTAGTPQFDNFDADGDPRQLHEREFTAPLPRALLGRPGGPLAVIGHVDQAFQHSFLWDDRLHDITHFLSTLTLLMKGAPVGAAMEPFNRRFAQVAARVAELAMRHGPTAEARLRYWLGYHDARNYLVLGDPAVRLNPLR